MIVTIGTLTDAHREVISALAARHRLPAVYPFPFFVRSGGLISYGPDIVDSFRGAAGYVDRILKGEKPADLPVHQPTKIDLAIREPQPTGGGYYTGVTNLGVVLLQKQGPRRCTRWCL